MKWEIINGKIVTKTERVPDYAGLVRKPTKEEEEYLKWVFKAFIAANRGV